MPWKRRESWSESRIILGKVHVLQAWITGRLNKMIQRNANISERIIITEQTWCMFYVFGSELCAWKHKLCKPKCITNKSKIWRMWLTITKHTALVTQYYSV